MGWRAGWKRWRGAPAEAGARPAQRAAPGRLDVWREVLGIWWVAVPVALSALAVAAFQLDWKLPGVGLLNGEPWASPFLVLASLLAVALEGSHRAVSRRQRQLEERRQELERLIRLPQRRLVQAKYHLYRDAFMCTQLVGFLMMTRMEASAMTAETALGIERSWGSGFLERFQRMFGTGRFGDVFSRRIGGIFPPPRDQAMAIYVGLADFLNLLADRITEGDLDPAYLHGRDEAPEPKDAAKEANAPDPSAAPAGAQAAEPAAEAGQSPAA